MKKIVLLCNQGLSTSVLVKNMREVVERNNLDYLVNAYSVDSAPTTAVMHIHILEGQLNRNHYL